ncbi:MAG: TIM-barrel domain-containing protein [Candidatus Fimenecus sp.]
MAELNKRMLAATKGAAFEENIIKAGNVRVSVLTERMLRIEFSADGKFTDLPSQTVWYRNFGKVVFTSAENADVLTVRTASAEFQINCHTGNFKYAVIDGKSVAYSPSNNLKGTTRTLDQTFGPKELDDGIISLDGVSVYDDSKTLLLKDDGMLCPREKGTKDTYVFAFGKDYVGWINDFYKITGKPPLIPRYVLGNWWSRYRAYTQKEYEDLMEEFFRRDIPLTIATVDMDWHWVDIKGKFGMPNKKASIWGSGWTGYSWNTDLFPDYKGFLNKLHDMGLKVTLNLHPADGVRSFEDMYGDMAEAMGIDEKTGQTVEFDLTDKTFINAYFDILHHPYENQGVDFWWIDWQQGTKSKKAGLDPLWLLNHYHYLDTDREKRRPMILSRYAGIGSHRYPLGFSGDTAINWSVLNFQPYFTANAANCGYTWWSHDIGGHHMGEHDDELYIRWLQFGVFSPIMRLHSTNWEFLGKEPWNFSWEAETLSTQFLRLRHKLIPYIYAMNYRSFNEGRALCEPMYYTYPQENEAFEYKNEYMFGSELLVCPVTTKLDEKTKTAATKMWLPEGRWTNIFDGKIYIGGQKVIINSPINTIPVLAREGAIIPMSEDGGNAWQCPDHLKILVYRGNNTFDFYEDDGESGNYKNGEYSISKMTVSETADTLTFTVSGGKALACIPKCREYTVEFKDIEDFDTATVKVNGVETSATVGKSFVTVHNVKVEDEIEITLKGISARKNKPINERVLDCIIHLNGSNIKKKMIQSKAADCKTDKDYASLVRKARSKAFRMCLDEAVNAME